MRARWRNAVDRVRGPAALLAGGGVGAAVLMAAQVPAGALVGACIGSAVVRHRGEPAHGPAWVLPLPVRTSGLLLLGCAAGVRLDGQTLATLGRILLPLLAALLALVLVNAAVAVVLVRRYSLDPITAVLACAPGGMSELAITAQERGARVDVVLAVHLVRLVTVVVVVLPLLVMVLA